MDKDIDWVVDLINDVNNEKHLESAKRISELSKDPQCREAYHNWLMEYGLSDLDFSILYFIATEYIPNQERASY